MKLICTIKKLGVDVVRTLTTAEGTNHATHIKNVPGVGKPFLLFANLPDGNPVSVDFTDAPIVSSNTAENQSAIDAMLETPPWSALNY